jgi:Protein of unknown function (DUF3617)
MRSRYKGGAGRAAGLAVLGVSGALGAQTLDLNPGNYQLLMTTEPPPQAAATASPDMPARLKGPEMHDVCISESKTQSQENELAQDMLLAGQGSDPSCRVAQQSSSGNQMKFVLQCAHSTLRFDGLLAVNSYRATVLVRSDQGQTTTINLQAQRVGGCTR